MVAPERSALRVAEALPGRVRTATFTAARQIARRLVLDRQIDFWMQEVRPAWSLGALRARVVDVIVETHDVRTFVLAPNAHWPGHRAGQFVTVEIEIEGVRVQRCYSLSSAPGRRRVAITVKRVPSGRVSSFLHDHVGRGQVLRLGMPAGDFVCNSEASATGEPLLLLSGGSGVTPVMSILRDLSRRDAVKDVVFLHAARSRRDVIFESELEMLRDRHPGLRVAFSFDDEVGGRLDRDKLRAAVPDLAERKTMLCGPVGMMEALAPVWTEAGLERRLKIERFAPKRVAPPPADTPAKVKLALVQSGREVATERVETILEQLERGGEKPAHGCRMGICNTCMCRKRSGVVENILTGAVSSAPDEDIRICVSRARSDIELER